MTLHDRTIELLRLIKDLDTQAKKYKDHFNACKRKCFDELREIDEKLAREARAERKVGE